MTHVENVDGTVLEILATDQSTAPIEYFLSRLLNTVTILSTQVSEDNTLTLAPGHGVVVGNFIEIYNVNPLAPVQIRKSFAQLLVVSVVGDVVRVGNHFGFDSNPSTIQFAKRTSINMNIVGTLDAPIKFEIGPPNGFEWDLTRSMLGMVLAGTPDDSKFGDISGGLANGIFFGFENDFYEQYLVNIILNAGLRGTAYDVSYQARSVPAGSYGLSMRKSFSGPDKYGVVIRLAGLSNDKFVMYLQDDLSSLIEFGFKIMGHHTTESGLLT